VNNNAARVAPSEEARLIDENDSQKDKYLTFHLGMEDYGIEIRHVTEIIGIQKITPVPDLPEFIKGVINLRGQVIPVMDVRTRFKMPPRDYDDRTCIIVVKVNDRAIGLVVDKVNEVADISQGQIEPPPKTRLEREGGYLQGLGKLGEEVKILLDVDALLGKQESDQLPAEVEVRNA
jgi:purine-binding chemotaxis protein CheW